MNVDNAVEEEWEEEQQDEEWQPPSVSDSDDVSCTGEDYDDNNNVDAMECEGSSAGLVPVDEFDGESFVERLHVSAFHSVEYALHLALSSLSATNACWSDLLIIQEEISSAIADLTRCNKQTCSNSNSRRKLGAACFHVKRALDALMPCTLPFIWSSEDVNTRKVVPIMPSLNTEFHLAKCKQCMSRVVPDLETADHILCNIQWDDNNRAIGNKLVHAP